MRYVVVLALLGLVGCDMSNPNVKTTKGEDKTFHYTWECKRANDGPYGWCKYTSRDGKVSFCERESGNSSIPIPCGFYEALD